jgi:predicted AAA+ superfamily ATPase
MYVVRDIKEGFERRSDVYSMIALVGARQAGKTTFLKRQMGPSASYVLFDDPDARSMFEEDVKKFEAQYVEGRDLTVLDEVQYCRDAGPKLKYLVDTGRRLWITSSSEILLGREVLSYLVGRVSTIRLHPFSLREFLRAKGQQEITPAICSRMTWEHATYGGYPKVVLTEDPQMKRTILRDLYETMLLKDVARTFAIDDIRALEDLGRYLAINAGALISYQTLSKTIGISFQTVKKYIGAMQKSYLLMISRPFFTNRGKEISKTPRIYFLDTGLRNAIANGFKADLDGPLFENYVLTELLKMGYSPRFWRTKAKAEVDFVIEHRGEPIPVEVKLTAEPGEVGRSLRSFINAYIPRKAFMVFYKGRLGKMDVGECSLTFTDVKGLWEALAEIPSTS